MSEEQLKVFETLVKARMDAIGLQYSQQQAEKLADFVSGIALLTKEIEKDNIIRTIKEMK